MNISKHKFLNSKIYQNKTLIAFIISVFFLFKIMSQIMIFNTLGYSNQGDFYRNIVLSNIGYDYGCIPQIKRGFCTSYIFTHYKNLFDQFGNFGLSTAQLFIVMSKYLALLFDPTRVKFSIFYVGFVYSAFYAGGYFFFLKPILNSAHSILFKCFFVLFSFFILSDLLFTSFFNTFFDEPAFIVCMLWFTTLFLFYKNLTLELIFCFLIIMSKHQNLIFFMLLPLVFYKYRKFGKLWIVMIFFTAFCFYNHSMSSKIFGLSNSTNAIFNGLLYGETLESSENILKKINIDPYYAKYKGFTYSGNSTPPDINTAFIVQSKSAKDLGAIQNQLDFFKVLDGYMHYPKKLFINFKTSLKLLSTFGPYSDYSRNTPANYQQEYIKSFFSKIILKNVVYLIYLFSIVSFLIIAFRMFKKINLLFLNYFLCALISIFVLFLGDGFAEIMRHATELYYLSALLIVLLFLSYRFEKI